MTDEPTPPQSAAAVPAVMHIGEVAARTELSLRSLRHWDEVGLLRPSGAPMVASASTPRRTSRRSCVIRRMKPLGFTLEEMSAAMRDIESLLDPEAGADAQGGARSRLDQVLEEAADRRVRLARQLAMADEFLGLLRRQLGHPGS